MSHFSLNGRVYLLELENKEIGKKRGMEAKRQQDHQKNQYLVDGALPCESQLVEG